MKRPKVCQEEEFLQLSVIQLISLIRKDELNVQEETEVYNAVLNWASHAGVDKKITIISKCFMNYFVTQVKYDEENRYPKMEHILCAVRCQYIPPSFLKDQMKNCALLKKLPACREYLDRIFKVNIVCINLYCY